MRNILCLILLFWLSSVYGQDFVLKGYAPDFIGETVVLYGYQDYITRTKVELGKGKVSAVDSTFNIPLKNKSTIKVVVEIGRTEASLYLAPKTDYEIYFPKSDGAISSHNATTQVYFNQLDTTDINYRILRYQQWFDTFISYYELEISRGQFAAYLDTFKLYAANAYKDVDDVYFLTYVRYDLAEMEQGAGLNRSSEGRLNTFLNYIEPFPVYFENDRYMKFILGFYKKSFSDYLPDSKRGIYMALEKSSPTLLMKALRSDLFLANPQLREMIMIDKLGKAFYDETYYRENILTILDSVITYPKFKYNSAVANNVKNYLTSLESGYPAPEISLQLSADSTLTWQNYKGRYVYLNFFNTASEDAVSEMKLIEQLYRKYGKDISFLSVCTNEKAEDFNQFRAQYLTYDWDIVHLNDNRTVLDRFKVHSMPAYYMIDQEGFIHSAPALGPTPNGENESIERTMFVIQKALNRATTPKVGER
jgi:peroxiredoxin